MEKNQLLCFASERLVVSMQINFLDRFSVNEPKEVLERMHMLVSVLLLLLLKEIAVK